MWNGGTWGASTGLSFCTQHSSPPLSLGQLQLISHGSDEQPRIKTGFHGYPPPSPPQTTLDFFHVIPWNPQFPVGHKKSTRSPNREEHGMQENRNFSASPHPVPGWPQERTYTSELYFPCLRGGVSCAVLCPITQGRSMWAFCHVGVVEISVWCDSTRSVGWSVQGAWAGAFSLGVPPESP